MDHLTALKYRWEDVLVPGEVPEYVYITAEVPLNNELNP